MSRLGLPKDAPPLPEGYHYEQVMTTDPGVRVEVSFRGARIFIVSIFIVGITGNWEKQKRYFARPVQNLADCTEYPDLSTLVTSMITKHRLGVI